jgi:predicted dehydrogenase
MGKINFGIIGCSNVASRRFIPALLQSQYANLEMIGSRDSQKAAKFADKFKCNKHGTYRDVINDPDVDAVYISTPITLREELVSFAIKNNKHVISEKPAFLDYNTASKVVSLCKENKVRIMEGWVFKYHPQHTIVKKHINDNRIGAVKYFDGQFTYPLPGPDNIRLKPELAGGVFYDSVGYPVAAAQLFISNKPASVFCIRNFDEKYSVDNFVRIQIQFENNVNAHAVAGFGLHYSSTYSINGSKGRISVKRAYAVGEDMETTISIETDEGDEEITVPPHNQFLSMIDGFCSQILANESPNYDFEDDMLTQHLIMDAAMKSSINKELVFLVEKRE